MKLEADQVGRLFAAGSLAIPPAFPDKKGQISVHQTGIEIVPNERYEPSVEVVYYSAPTQKTRCIMALKDLTAIYLPKGLTGTEGPNWIVGSQLLALVSELAKAVREGTVFAKEHAGAIMCVEIATTVGEFVAAPKGCALI